MRLLAGLLVIYSSNLFCQVTVIHAGRVVDVEQQKVLENQSIVVEGDRIREIRPTAGETLPANASVIDLTK